MTNGEEPGHGPRVIIDDKWQKPGKPISNRIKKFRLITLGVVGAFGIGYFGWRGWQGWRYIGENNRLRNENNRLHKEYTGLAELVDRQMTIVTADALCDTLPEEFRVIDGKNWYYKIDGQLVENIFGKP